MIESTVILTVVSIISFFIVHYVNSESKRSREFLRNQQLEREKQDLKHQLNSVPYIKYASFKNEVQNDRIKGLEKQLELERQQKHKEYIESERNKSKERRKRTDKLDSEAISMHRVDVFKELYSKSKESTKFKPQKSINKNIKDPITGETLDIVVCYCGTTYHKDTFNLYGCDCDSKLLNQK